MLRLCLALLFCAPFAAASLESASVRLFATSSCTGTAESTVLSAEAPFLSLCNGQGYSEKMSMLLPPGHTIAIYKSCRASPNVINDPNPKFYETITATNNVAECIEVETATPDNGKLLSFQLIGNTTDVCLEYARTAARFCDMEECSDACAEATQAMVDFGADRFCAGMDVAGIAPLGIKAASKAFADDVFMVKQDRRPTHGGQRGVARPADQTRQNRQSADEEPADEEPAADGHICYYKYQNRLVEKQNQCDHGRIVVFIMCTLSLFLIFSATICFCRLCCCPRRNPNHPPHNQTVVVVASPDMAGPSRVEAVQAIVVPTNGEVTVVCAA